MRYTSVLLCKTSVAGVALSKAIQTCKNLQAAFARSHGFRHGSCLTRKRKALCTQFMCKGRMSRGTTFSCKALLRISFFCNGKSRNHLLTWKHPTLNFLSDLLCRVFSTHSFCFRFSNPVRKLPSAPALLDDLSAGESSSLMAPGAYSSFSSLFSYLLS